LIDYFDELIDEDEDYALGCCTRSNEIVVADAHFLYIRKTLR
jgi:hypothetical protein